ncbi:MAG: hypothetical protein JWN73_3759 [Betaproteobacteria bacterium]|nr:hypothetical protein [Betaproteobacteria bacterium]
MSALVMKRIAAAMLAVTLAAQGLPAYAQNSSDAAAAGAPASAAPDATPGVAMPQAPAPLPAPAAVPVPTPAVPNATVPYGGEPQPPLFDKGASPDQAPSPVKVPAAQPNDPCPCDANGKPGSGRFDALDSRPALTSGNSNLPAPVTSSRLPDLLRSVSLPDTGKIVMEIERDNIPADGQTMVPMTIRLYGADGKPYTAATEVLLKTTRGRLRRPDASPIEAPRNDLRLSVKGGEAVVYIITTHEPGDAQLIAQSGNVVVQGKMTMLPDLRPMLAVGVVEGAFNLRSIDASKLAQPRSNDAFELEIKRMHPFGAGDGKAELGARSAFFLKGMVKGDYLLTLAYDSEKDVRNVQFRDINPDQFYPIYGDSSIKGFDAQSSQRLYVRVDKGKSFFLYGDFSTASTTPARQLGSYSRTITGAKEHYENEVISANVWATRDNATRIVDEQPARGTSGPYALTSNQGISGSERVEILTRDRNQPAIILTSVDMVRFSDYEFEPFSGSIIFKAPVPSVDANLNPISIRVTYEVDQGGPKFWLGGVDGQWKIFPGVEIGGSVVEDRNPTDLYRLASVNSTVRLGSNTYVVGEYARSNHELLGELGRGDGKRIELRHKSENLEGRLYYGMTDKTFDNIASQLNGGRAEGGAVGSYKITNSLSARVDAYTTEDKVSEAKQESGYFGLRWKATERWGFGLGYRHVNNSGGPVNAASVPGYSTLPNQPGFTPTQISAPLFAAQPGQVISFNAVSLSADVQVTDRLKLLGEFEQDVEQSSRKRYTFGGDYRLNDQYRAYGRAEIADGLGGINGLGVPDSRQRAAVAGISSNYMKGGEMFNEYRLRDAIDGRTAMNATGLRNTYMVAEGMRINVGAEHQATLSGINATANAITGALDLTYNPRWRASARLEFRQDPNFNNYLSTTAFTAKVDRDWSLLTRNEYLYNASRDPTVASTLQDRFQIGGAYRDTDTNKVNALMLYEMRYQMTNPQPGYYERLSHVISGNIDYHPSRPLWLNGRVAAKWVGEHFDGDVYSSYTAMLVGGRAVYDLTEKWDIGAQANVMYSPQGHSTQTAIGVEAGYLLRQNLWVTAGFNFTGFSDRELDGAGYTNRGIYIRLRFKFDENLFHGDDPVVNRSLTPMNASPVPASEVLPSSRK